MASMFEGVMNACLESKKTPVKKTVTESKKAVIKRLKENDETILMDDEVLMGEPIEDTEDVVDDVVDDIMVVVDPEMDDSSGEVIDRAAEAQDIIDGTPEGEVPTTDEYIGDYTYTCPICGNTFFSEVEMADGDECPVCGEFPNGYVLVGEVQSTEEEVEEVEDEEVEVPEETDEELDLADEEEEELVAVDPVAEESVKIRTAYSRYSLDESTFNPFMTKFIKENYKNAKSFAIVGATKKGSKLALECKLLFKSGKSKTVTLTVENFKPAKKMTLAAREDGTFKSESKNTKVAPFVFESIMTPGRVIKCTGMKYNFVTTLGEGKKAQVSGKLIRESKSRK